MKFDKEFFDEVSTLAKGSPRLRMNLDLRTNPNDSSQRMFNALEPGTIIPIHRHLNSSETIIVIRGSLNEYLYDSQGKLLETIHFVAGSNCIGMNIPKGQWHSLECLEANTIIFEAKDGFYKPLSSNEILKK